MQQEAKCASARADEEALERHVLGAQGSLLQIQDSLRLSGFLVSGAADICSDDARVQGRPDRKQDIVATKQIPA